MENNEFGKKVESLRKEKGLTQEKLSQKTNISIRTIQRIEKGEVKPRAYTVKILSEALGYNLLSLNNKKINAWVIAIHLSNFIPLIIIPLFIWLFKREESEMIDVHGIKVINYQIIVFLINLLFMLSPLFALSNPDLIFSFVKFSAFYTIAYWGLNSLFTIANLIWAVTGKKIIYPNLKIVR